MILFPAPQDAWLFKALDLHPGQHVLEIGTGSGDVTALLASLVGENGQVVSIAIHETLASLTRRILEERKIQNVHIVQGDGFSCYPAEARYDRIVAMGSVRAIPFAWLEQLAPGGVLVANLVGNLASVFLRLVRQRTAGRGIFLPVERKRFAELHATTPFILPEPPEELYAHPLVQEYPVTFDLPTLLANEAFLFFLQCELPHLHRYGRSSGLNATETVQLFDPVLNASLTSQTREDNWIVRVCGDSAIWEQIERCYYRWQQRGHPRPVDFHFHMRAGKEYILYPATGEVWMVPM